VDNPRTQDSVAAATNTVPEQPPDVSGNVPGPDMPPAHPPTGASVILAAHEPIPPGDNLALWLYCEFKSFFSTGLFYIALGIGFLWIAFHNLESHPAFIFLIVILGVAIILYGTGTQAAGSGNTGQLNIAIAGGAGALAAFFGFGVIHYYETIQRVFKYTKDYAVLELSSDDRTADLQDYEVRAESYEGQPLHLWKKGQTIQVLIPLLGQHSRSETQIYIRQKVGLKEWRDEFTKLYRIDWTGNGASLDSAATEKIERIKSGAGESIYRVRATFVIKKSEVASRALDEKAQEIVGGSVRVRPE
jgi:hypothetical protein